MGQVEDIQTLIAGLESGYLKRQVWEAWSERALLESQAVPPWLVDLHDAKDAREALGALYRGWQKTEIKGSLLDQFALYRGFLYLRYQAGDLTMNEVLARAGEYSDGRNGYPSCEAFYLLLNEYEGCGSAHPFWPGTFEERVESLFLSCVRLAEERLACGTWAEAAASLQLALKVMEARD